MSQEKESKHHPYLPHTEADRKQMLESIGAGSFEDLVSHIPQAVRLSKLDIPDGLSEFELTQFLAGLAAKNVPTSKQLSFLGGGCYRRYVPAAVGSIVSRSEFATAYTPYQPEVSQGTLQVIYEFQTAICLLTGMDVANASLYDGPTACAEAALMSARVTGRNKIVMAESVNPEYKDVTKTYADTIGLDLAIESAADGFLANPKIDSETACLVVQYPNYFGLLENLKELSKTAHDAGALLVVIACPVSLGLLTPPGEFDADIVIGDGQQCGNNLSFGGPSVGFMAVKQSHLRQLPGRLCGITVDNRGSRAFTLTLQTREQHIRRAKATSNICTNQALNATTMLVYLTLMGPKGLKQIADTSMKRAHKLAELLTALPGVKLRFARPFFAEFVIETPFESSLVLERLKAEGVLGGHDLSAKFPALTNCILVAVTETNPPEELERYAHILSSVLTSLKSGSKNEAKMAGCCQN